jgi:hypothetical protein
MTMILKPRQSFAATTAARTGFVSVHDKSLPTNTPHFREGHDLDKMLKAMDRQLEVGYIFDHTDHRKHRWAVMRHADDGGQSLIRIIQGPEQSYQKPDERTFLDLQKHRLAGPNGRKWLKDAMEQEDRLEAEKAKKRAEEMGEFRDSVAKHVRDNRFKGKQGQTVF